MRKIEKIKVRTASFIFFEEKPRGGMTSSGNLNMGQVKIWREEARWRPGPRKSYFSEVKPKDNMTDRGSSYISRKDSMSGFCFVLRAMLIFEVAMISRVSMKVSSTGPAERNGANLLYYRRENGNVWARRYVLLSTVSRNWPMKMSQHSKVCHSQVGEDTRVTLSPCFGTRVTLLQRYYT